MLIGVKIVYDDEVLTEREQQIVELLRRDPLMSSAALAAALETTRASINVHLSNLGKKGVILGRGYVLADRPAAVVVGGANVDMKAQSTARAATHTSNPGHASMTPGGVGRNIAENLARLGNRVHLISMVGRDSLGAGLLEHTAAAGVRIDNVARTDRSTGTYTAILDANGELLIAIADMQAMDELTPGQLQSARDVIATAGVLVLDGNLRRDTFECALDLAPGIRTIVEPVSAPKAAALKDSLDARVFAITPDREELGALTDLPTRTDRQIRTAANALHDRGISVVWVTLGARGSLLATPEGFTEIAALPTTVTEVTGAGDSMVAAFCHVLLEGGTPLEAAHLGHAAAAVTIASPHTVRPDLSLRLLHAAADQKELT